MSAANGQVDGPVDVVKRQDMSPRTREDDDLRRNIWRDGLASLVMRDVALGHADTGSKSRLGDAKPLANVLDGCHGTNNSATSHH